MNNTNIAMQKTIIGITMYKTIWIIDSVLPTVLNDLWFGDLTFDPMDVKTKPIIAKINPKRLIPEVQDTNEKIKPVKDEDCLLPSSSCSSSGEIISISFFSSAILCFLLCKKTDY